MSNLKRVKAAVEKWLQPLGLEWWDVKIVYYSNPTDIVRIFASDEFLVVPAKTWADWRYGTAEVAVNLPAFDEIDKDKVETVILHELIHVLVNEMRTVGLDHEERVVTGLTKAFLWVEAAAKENKP
jgi:Zn-dependent protease with chaperone function